MAMAAVVGLGIASAAMQVIGANQEAKAYEQQAEYNARIYEQQAGMIEEKKILEGGRSDRAIARMRSTARARTAGAGLELSGSPLAVMVDTESQMLLDRNINLYNLEVEKRVAKSGAAMTRWQGKDAARTTRIKGYSNAFKTLLTTAYSAYTPAPATATVGSGATPFRSYGMARLA